VNYNSLIEFIRENKKTAIENMRTKSAVHFAKNLGNKEFDQEKELEMLRIEIAAIDISNEVIESILEKLESGGN
jgi:signal recognition particle GTPase